MKNKLKDLRKKLNLTLQEVADKVGTSNVQISRFETGKRKLSLDWLLRLCEALGVTADEIVDLPLKRTDAVQPHYSLPDQKSQQSILLVSVLVQTGGAA
jgi:transcriptional regulator with XRE-family HTH domain